VLLEHCFAGKFGAGDGDFKAAAFAFGLHDRIGYGGLYELDDVGRIHDVPFKIALKQWILA
ncbi:MAG TPA: hypothetical protein PLI96_06050, partial [Halothiobacillus sp.]|nr:hypothetical protein [Halothiobacillus sp.]